MKRPAVCSPPALHSYPGRAILDTMVVARRFSDEEAWVSAIADDFASSLRGNRGDAARPVICLAGGSTPTPAYRAMASILTSLHHRGDAPVTLVIGDERVDVVSPIELNATMLLEAFAPAIAYGAASLLRWSVEYGEARATLEMAGALDALADWRAGPMFEVCYLGLGADGHTAGLFPGSVALSATGSVTNSLAPSSPRTRVSLTLGALSSAKRTRFIVREAGKEAALKRLLSGDPECPAVRASTTDAIAFVLG